MPQAHQNSQLHSSCRHHERTYNLSRQECHKHIKTVSFIPASGTMRGLTCCQGKNATSTSNSQLHSSSRHHERTYLLSRQECHKDIKTVSFIPAAGTMRGLTCCQGKNATST